MDTLQVILPVFNEVESISAVLDEWKNVLDPLNITYAYIICEDGSTDGTIPLLQSLKKKHPLVFNQKEYRRGYGMAVIDGISSADAAYIFCSDSDGQCDPHDFITLWNHRSATSVVKGYRAQRADAQQRKLFSGLFGGLHRLLFPSDLKDPSAPFVLFNPSLIRPYLDQLMFLSEGFWWGFTAVCIKNNIPIKEFSMTHRKRMKGSTNVFHLRKIPAIAMRNIIGLIKLKLHR